MGLYASIAEFRAQGYQATTTAISDPNLEALLERASRVFDRLAGVSDDHFAAAPGTATARTFYGDGTDFLELDEFDTGTTPVVAMPDGYTVVDYSIIDGRLVRTYGDNGTRSSQGFASWYGYWFEAFNSSSGWPEGVPVTVTAKWGSPVGISADITFAVIKIAIRIWRFSDPAFAKTVDLEGESVDDWPLDVREIADSYRVGETAFLFA